MEFREHAFTPHIETAVRLAREHFKEIREIDLGLKDISKQLKDCIQGYEQKINSGSIGAA